MRYVKDSKLLFNSVLSGPCNLTDILYYVYLINNKKVYCQTTNRDKHEIPHQDGVIGYAWTLCFMNGLNIVDTKYNGINHVMLTDKGEQLYQLITKGLNHYNISHHTLMDHPNIVHNSLKIPVSTANNKDPFYPIGIILYEVLRRNKPIYDEFKIVLKEILKESNIYYNFCVYLTKKFPEERMNPIYCREFYDDFFEAMYILYDMEGYSREGYNKDAKTTTGANRVPSFLELLEIVNVAVIKRIEHKKYVLFNQKKAFEILEQ